MTHTVTHTGEKTQRTGREVRLPNRCAGYFLEALLPYLCHEVPHGLSCLVLLLPGGVGVGPQGEPGVEVALDSYLFTIIFQKLFVFI